MELIFRIGRNSRESMGVFEARFTNEEVKDKERMETTLMDIKSLYFKHRVEAANDPQNIKKALKQP